MGLVVLGNFGKIFESLWLLIDLWDDLSLQLIVLALLDMALNDFCHLARLANDGEQPMRVFTDGQEDVLDLSVEKIDILGPPSHLLELDV